MIEVVREDRERAAFEILDNSKKIRSNKTLVHGETPIELTKNAPLVRETPIYDEFMIGADVSEK